MKPYSLALLFCSALLCGAESALLTDNPQTSLFPSGTKRLSTGAKIHWVTKGEFACDPGIVKTGSRPDGRSRVLLDGRSGSDGACQAFGQWGGKDSGYATFTVDLGKAYRIDFVSLWSQQRDMIGTGKMEILLSNDNQKFISSGSISIDPKERSPEKCGKRFDHRLEKPAAARYVQFRLKKRPGAWQQILSEIAVWGGEAPLEELKKLSPENNRPGVDFSIRGIQSGAVCLDWSKSASAIGGIKQWGFYTADTDGKMVLKEILPARTTRKIIYPLDPGRSYSFGISAIYPEGEDPNLRRKTYRVPEPFACETFGDMLAINYFWGGDGEAVRQPHPDQRSWDLVAIQFLGSTPVKQVRWWRAHEHVAKLLYGVGIGMFSWPHVEDGKKIGMHTFCAGNEPELGGSTPAQYVENLKKNYAKVRAAHPSNRLAAPAVNIGNEALKYLEAIYKLGGKNFFDVLDLHTYGGSPENNPRLPGYPKGSPEYLLERMELVNALRKQYNDTEKPMISTEFGYTDGQIANPIGYPISKERIAQFLTRGLILHHVLGFRRVFVYSFWDAGTDPNDTEHHFGMIDWHLQKKPSYHAFCTLGQELGNSVLTGPVRGCDNKVVFGYQYRDANGRHTAVIWDGRGDYSGRFKTVPGKLGIVQLYGEKSEIQTAPDGTFRTVFGPSVIYLHSSGPVELLSARKIPGKTDAPSSGIRFRVESRTLVSKPGARKLSIPFSLKNPSDHPTRISCALESSSGQILAEKQVTLLPGKELRTSFDFVRGTRILEQCKIRISYEDGIRSRFDSAPVFLRFLQENNGKVNVSKQRMAGYDSDVVVLSDDRLEITVDSKRGGRILEILDKRNGANQVHLNYEHLGGLEKVNFAYAIWDRVRAPGKLAISPGTEYRAEIHPSGVRLSAGGNHALSLEKVLTLNGKGGLRMDIALKNETASPVVCSWYLHPEYTVGGSGDHGTDVLRLPVGGEILTMGFWNALGHKPTHPFSEGWWSVTDTVRKVKLEQRFDLKQFRTPRLWFGIGCYNLEMESKQNLKLAPGETWNGTLEWTLSEGK